MPKDEADAVPGRRGAKREAREVRGAEEDAPAQHVADAEEMTRVQTLHIGPSRSAPRGRWRWRTVAAILAVVYVAGRIGVELAINGRWAPSAEQASHFLLVPLAQSAVVWWLAARRGSSRP